MNILEQIQKSSPENLSQIIQNRIKACEQEAIEEDINVLGYHLNYNPEEYYLTTLSNEKIFHVDVRCFISGYIKKGTKMVYGLAYDNNRLVSNDGRYYYIDDDSYINEFCDFIKDKDIINEFELFDYILEFIKMYLGTIKEIEREDMFKMIYKSDRVYYNPINKHSIKWFKGRGNAMCSEYAILAQNILNFLGIDSYLVIGREKTGNEKSDSHAFNIVSFIEKESQEEINALIDFANHTEVLDINFKKIGESPFIGELENFNQEFVLELVNDEKHLVFEDYSYFLLGNQLIKIGYHRNRDYYIEDNLTPDTIIKKKNAEKIK